MKRNYLKTVCVVLGIVAALSGLGFLLIYGLSDHEEQDEGVAQIPLEVCDSLMANSIEDKYGIVYKDGKCGVYDIQKRENVTDIEYPPLYFSTRTEMEDGSWYSYFTWEEETQTGTIGVAEATNTFMVVTMPKKDK